MELLPLLCVLGVCASLALGDDVKAFAPEDLDGSGDDEDYSGSGAEGFFDLETKDVNIFSTPVSLLVPTVTQMSTDLQRNVAVEVASEMEHTTKLMETTKPHDIIEDLFAVKDLSSEQDTGLKPTTQQPFIVGTTFKPATEQPFTVESADEEKHPPHHHHHHPHHHTTTPVNSFSEDLAVDPVVEEASSEDKTTIKPTSQHESAIDSVHDLEKKHHHHHPHHHTTTAEFGIDYGTTASTKVEKHFVVHEESTPRTPDESDVDEVAQKVTPTTENSVQYDHHQEAASGSGTPYVDEETTTHNPGIDEFPIFVETTVADETHVKGRHHHHPSHTTATTTLNGSGIIFEETINDELKPEGNYDEQDRTTITPADDRPHDHHPHHPHPSHHTTLPSATQSTASENYVVRTHEPKGRRFNVPHLETTAAFPVKEGEHIPEGMEPIDSSEGPSGDTEDFFIEGTVKNVQKEKIDAAAEDGNSDSSHGIMDRTELLAGIIAGGMAGLVFAAALVAFVFYRMKKKDEGSYSLEEPKQSNGGYQKPREQREFYA